MVLIIILKMILIHQKNKLLQTIFAILLLIFLVPSKTYGDIGPKPYIIIELDGLENQVYYITLLSKSDSSGPNSVSDEEIPREYFAYDIPYYKIAWQSFREYKDDDNFYFIEYFDNHNEENEFVWNYMPPNEFKILLYFPETDKFAVSDIYERYAFKSYFKAKVEDLNTRSNKDTLNITVEKNYRYILEILFFIVRVIFTVSIEISIALLFGLRKKNILLFIGATNIITQIILNILLSLANYYSGILAFIFLYIFIEFLIFIIEAIIFSIYFHRLNKRNSDQKISKYIATIYSLTANATSFIFGIIISFILEML